MPRLHAVSLVAAVALLACGKPSGPRDAGPRDAGIPCASDSDCPSGQTCDTSTGLCTVTQTTESCHTCACVDTLSMGGCADLCDDAQNGNPDTPNFCNSVAALSQCSNCLTTNCGGLSNPPDPGNPTPCN